MAKVSAGLLMYRVRDGTLDLLLVHPGGPFWQKKDDGAWTIPKGEVEEGEEALAAAANDMLGAPTSGYRQYQPGGAAKASALIAELL